VFKEVRIAEVRYGGAEEGAEPRVWWRLWKEDCLARVDFAAGVRSHRLVPAILSIHHVLSKKGQLSRRLGLIVDLKTIAVCSG
jgi:hypothetical protein